MCERCDIRKSLNQIFHKTIYNIEEWNVKSKTKTKDTQ